MAGKGDKRRPLSVTINEYNENYDRIFKKRKKTPKLSENDKK